MPRTLTYEYLHKASLRMAAQMHNITLARAWIKATLVLLNTLCNQISFSPPHPPVNADDQHPYSSDEKARDILPGVGRWLAFTFKLTIHFFNVMELYAILTSLYPEYGLPPVVHHILIPVFKPALLEPTLPFLMGTLLIHTATYLRFACYRLLGHHFTYELAILQDHKLVTTGPYAYVRHPSYSGILMFILGVTLTHMNRGSWWVQCGLKKTVFGKMMLILWAAVVSGGVSLCLSRVKKEDKILRKEFKDEWVTWRKKTPYALVPFIY